MVVASEEVPYGGSCFGAYLFAGVPLAGPLRRRAGLLQGAAPAAAEAGVGGRRQLQQGVAAAQLAGQRVPGRHQGAVPRFGERGVAALAGEAVAFALVSPGLCRVWSTG